MENKKTCADCINLGREVYCMKCKRLKNGRGSCSGKAADSEQKVIGSGWHGHPLLYFTSASAYTTDCFSRRSYGNAARFL